MLSQVLSIPELPPPSLDGITGVTFPVLMEMGNSSFRGGKVVRAICLYTAAIAQSELALDIALVLSNISLCALRIVALHDAIAASAASLRLRLGAKPVHRCANALALLGEFVLADEMLGAVNELAGGAADASLLRLCATLRREVSRARHAMSRYSCQEVSSCLEALHTARDGEILGEWLAESAIASAHYGSKGRGIRALRELRVGELPRSSPAALPRRPRRARPGWGGGWRRWFPVTRSSPSRSGPLTTGVVSRVLWCR